MNSANWDEEKRQIEVLCDVPGMTAGRLLRIREFDTAPVYFIHGKEVANRQFDMASPSWRYRSGATAFRIATVSGHYAPITSHQNNEIIVPAVADLIDPDTTAIVELGCAYGRHLFALRDVLEHRFPDLKYFGAELFEGAIAVGRRIATLEPDRAPVTFHTFDYRKPRLDFLPRCKKIMFFTCHSIEQVQQIDLDLFDVMINAAPVVRCVHSEPVGWQLKPGVQADLASGDFRVNAEAHMAFNLYGLVDDYRSAISPIHNGWNQNLMEQLLFLAKSGVINLERIVVNCAGNDTYNPSTMIEWSKR